MNKCEEQHHDDVLIITSSEHLLLSTDAGHTAATSILYSCLNAIITLRGTVFTASVITVTVGAGSTVRHDHIVAMWFECNNQQKREWTREESSLLYNWPAQSSPKPKPVMSRHDQAIGRHDQVMQVMGRHDQEAMTTGMTRLCHNQAMTIGMPCPGAGYDHALT
eukprot:scaffold138044_cov20-Tisochrysis_lutea.AAC.3